MVALPLLHYPPLHYIGQYLTSHVLKLFLEVLPGWVNKTLEDGMDDSQFGFRKEDESSVIFT